MPIALENGEWQNSVSRTNDILKPHRGWLELGNWNEANEELENITPQFKAHPEVLGLRFQIYSKAGNRECAAEIARSISDLLPDNPYGYFHLAFSLHELKRTREAYDMTSSFGVQLWRYLKEQLQIELGYALKKVEERFGIESVWLLVEWHNQALASYRTKLSTLDPR